METKQPVSNEYRYQMGFLEQCCTKCNWTEKEARVDLKECPECGTPLNGDSVIRFGGTIIRYVARKHRFLLSDNEAKQQAVIYEADLIEALVFLLRRSPVHLVQKALDIIKAENSKEGLNGKYS